MDGGPIAYAKQEAIPDEATAARLLERLVERGLIRPGPALAGNGAAGSEFSSGPPSNGGA